MKKQEKRSNQRPVSNSRSQLLETGLQGFKSTKAFTLVELIVVITILAILGTIAFISLQGYSKDARDSVRISDMSKIKTSLELFQLDAGKYPETTDVTNITYSGAIAWTQGTFGEATFNNVTKLDKIPKDPVSDRQYVYSVTNTKQEYQIAGVMEGDEVSYRPLPNPPLSGEGIATLVNQTNAAGKTGMLKISGNYNGKVLKVSTGATTYVLAVPSIITSSGFTLEQIVAGKTLAYNGYKNLPAQYAGSSYEVLGDNGINFVNNSDLVVYSGDLKTLSSSEQVGIDARKNLIEKLQNAYSGTEITDIGEISQILSTQTTNTGATEALSTTIVSNNLGGSITASSGGGSQTSTNSCATQPSYTYATFTVGTPTSVNQAYVKDATNCGYTCTDGYTGTSCEIAPPTVFLSNCTANGQIIYTDATGLEIGKVNNDGTTISGNPGSLTCAGNIIVCSGNNAGYTLQACNAGSSTVGTTASSYGNRYQFGKSDTSWINGNSLYTYDWKLPGGTDAGSANDWGILNVNKSSATYTNSDLPSKTLMQGPCANGYHIPTNKEWIDLVVAGLWGTNGLSMSNSLKLSMAGSRYWGNGALDDSAYGGYWSSSPSATSGTYLLFDSTGITSTYTNTRSTGFSIRCFKN